MQKQLTIIVDEDVYEGLHQVIGRRHISQFIEDLVRSHVIGRDLEAGYRAMAVDEAREAKALQLIASIPARRSSRSMAKHTKPWQIRSRRSANCASVIGMVVCRLLISRRLNESSSYNWI